MLNLEMSLLLLNMPAFLIVCNIWIWRAGAICHNGCIALHVDGHLFPTGLHWILLWLSQAGMPAEAFIV